MTLFELNQQMEKLSMDLGVKVRQLNVLELEYQKTYNNLLLTSQRPSQPLREAETQENLRQEEVFVKYWDLKTDVRVLLMQKDMLFEISRNLRSINNIYNG